MHDLHKFFKLMNITNHVIKIDKYIWMTSCDDFQDVMRKYISDAAISGLLLLLGRVYA